MTEIVDKPKGKSDLWKVFGFKKIDGKVVTDKAICRLCNFEYQYNTSSTTALRNHIQSKHKETLTKEAKSTSNEQPKISQSFQSTQSYPATSQKGATSGKLGVQIYSQECGTNINSGYSRFS
jgi:hypothetical protein